MKSDLSITINDNINHLRFQNITQIIIYKKNDFNYLKENIPLVLDSHFSFTLKSYSNFYSRLLNIFLKVILEIKILNI